MVTTLKELELDNMLEVKERQLRFGINVPLEILMILESLILEDYK